MPQPLLALGPAPYTIDAGSPEGGHFARAPHSSLLVRRAAPGKQPMSGRIKAGEGTLIGNAGEYYVAAELLKRGVIAALAPRNAPGCDILAAHSLKTVRIRVKTKSEEYTDWQWVVRKDGTIFRDLSSEGDFTVLVNLTRETKDLEFYVVPSAILNEWLTEDFEGWVRTPGKRGQPHNPSNKKRQLHFPKFADRLRDFRRNWDLLWEQAHTPKTRLPRVSLLEGDMGER